jgi:hypothetical protein
LGARDGLVRHATPKTNEHQTLTRLWNAKVCSVETEHDRSEAQLLSPADESFADKRPSSILIQSLDVFENKCSRLEMFYDIKKSKDVLAAVVGGVHFTCHREALARWSADYYVGAASSRQRPVIN